MNYTVVLQRLKALLTYMRAFFRRHWIGTVLIIFATLVFFWPIITRLDSYSEGGDASFNAWTLARNHHCLVGGESCASYVDGNIYFPHEDTMLFSETQLSAGLLTLPFYLINDNPLFSYNIWTILSVFLAAWFMYLLAKRLSRGNELISVLAGLIFAFAPFKIAAIFHLQNLSILYLPLAVLLIVKYLDTGLKRYLVGLFVALALLFYGSWVQMVFALIAIGVFVVGLLLTKLIPWKKAATLLGVAGAAAVSTLPLALEFMRFSKANDANFSIADQVLYSSSVADYLIPHDGTLIGKLYYWINSDSQRNAFNLDSFSYHGIVLYVAAAVLAFVSVRWYVQRKKLKTKHVVQERQQHKYVWIFLAMAVVGFVISLGPLLKLKGNFSYGTVDDSIALVFPAPWLLIDLFVPQLQFIRAIGRASVIMLFALCCMLAFVPVYLGASRLKPLYKRGILAAIVLLVIVEIMPFHRVHMATGAYAYNLEIPAVYKLIKERDDINNIVILRTVDDYKNTPIPVMRAEDVLWAGYHNKNIFNGYSGYTPPMYFETFYDFVYLEADDIPKMQKLGLKYVLIDKQLSAPRPFLMEAAKDLLPDRVYEDERYVLYKLPQQ